MLIAQLKKETNIAEYIIYMWQIEDIIRAYKFDIGKIDDDIISEYPQDEKVKEEIRGWYISLIKDMKDEGIEVSGHLNFLKEDVKGLGILHQTLLTTIQDKKYKQYYDEALIYINELAVKSLRKENNEIEVCLNVLYGLMLLRLNSKKISEATEESMKKISKLIAHLVFQYNNMKMGKLTLMAEMNN